MPVSKQGSKTNRMLYVSHIPFTLLILAIISTPWNGELFFALRLNDVFIISASMTTFFSLKFRRLPLLFVIFFSVILAGSTLINYDSWSLESAERLIFYYKYLAPLLVINTFLSGVRDGDRLKLVEISLFAVFLSLAIWPYLYAYFVSEQLIIGVSRVSYPGSRSYLTSDAHLYSSYLSISVVFYFLYLRNSLQHHALISIPLIVLCFGALVLTGSRNGILLLIISPLLVFLFWVFFNNNRLILYIRSFMGRIIGFLALLLVIYILFLIFFDFFSAGASRAFNFDLVTDDSARGRIVKFLIAIDDWLSNSLFFGASPFGASMIWYDSGLGIVLAHFGLAGLLIITFGLILFYRKVLLLGRVTSEVRAVLVISTLYIIANCITEFALVTRSMLPVFMYILVLYVVLFPKEKFTSELKGNSRIKGNPDTV